MLFTNFNLEHFRDAVSIFCQSHAEQAHTFQILINTIHEIPTSKTTHDDDREKSVGHFDPFIQRISSRKGLSAATDAMATNRHSF